MHLTELKTKYSELYWEVKFLKVQVRLRDELIQKMTMEKINDGEIRCQNNFGVAESTSG
jgi:hypothetical protein